MFGFYSLENICSSFCDCSTYVLNCCVKPVQPRKQDFTFLFFFWQNMFIAFPKEVSVEFWLGFWFPRTPFFFFWAPN